MTGSGKAATGAAGGGGATSKAASKGKGGDSTAKRLPPDGIPDRSGDQPLGEPDPGTKRPSAEPTTTQSEKSKSDKPTSTKTKSGRPKSSKPKSKDAAEPKSTEPAEPRTEQAEESPTGSTRASTTPASTQPSRNKPARTKQTKARSGAAAEAAPQVVPAPVPAPRTRRGVVEPEVVLVDPDETDDSDELEVLEDDVTEIDVADDEVADDEAAAESGTGADASRESRWSTRDRAREQELLAILAELPEEDPRRIAARDELVTMHMPLAAFLARRFRDRGEHLDDLTQVATVGLIKAVDRFEPGRGVEFSTFATPTIVGEIKRHFRDKGWAIRVPRRLQEMRLAITRATAELSQQTGSSPTVAELAAHLGLSEDEILEGLESAAAYATVSLDSTTGDGSDEGGATIAETVGDHDPSLLEVEHRATLNPLLARLGEREQRIVYMRFYENKTQAQIAAEIGVSQMHISRLLAKSLAQMRTSLAEA